MSSTTDFQTTLREMWETRPARLRSDRKIAGVAAAIARRYDVDPTLIRIGFVVAAFYGIGFALYLAGWVLLPSADDDSSPSRGPAGRWRYGEHPILLIALAIATIAAAGAIFGGRSSVLIGAAVAGGLLYMLHRSRGHLGVPGGPPGAASAARNQSGAAHTGGLHMGGVPTGAFPTDAVPTDAVPHDAGVAPGATTASTDAAGSDTVATGIGTETVSTEAGPHAGPATPLVPPTPPAWDPLGAAPFAWDLPEPTPVTAQPPTRRRRPLVTVVTIGLALLAGGIAGGILLAGGNLAGLRILLGIVLAVLGLGLVAGAFLRGGRGLILLAVPLMVLTYGVTAARLGEWHGIGELRATPATAAAVQSSYAKTIGEVDVDLRQIDLSTDSPAGSAPLTTSVSVGIGTARVLVPANADVQLHCAAQVGEAKCLGGDANRGASAELDKNDLGADGLAGGRTLVLDVSAGLGSVEVDRG